MAHYGKVPPQASDLEKVVLGAIMIERDAFDLVSDILKAECFYSDAHQYVFSAMQNLAERNKPIDLMTVVEKLIENGKLDFCGGPTYVLSLTNSVASAANIQEHARIVYEKYMKRELIKLTSELNAMAYDDSQDSFELQEYAETAILQIGLSSDQSEMKPIFTVMQETVKMIDEWRVLGEDVTGVPSGFPGIDKATRGWQPGDFIVLAARPSVGKTALALNIVKNAAVNKIKPVTVAVWSLEMKAAYLGLRMLAAESGKYLYNLQTGKITDDEMQEMLNGAVSALSKIKVFFDDKSKVTLSSICKKARRLKKKENLGLIVIDYLQLISAGDNSKGGNREQEVAKISRTLKELALELNIPIIALSQLSRTEGSKGITWEVGPPISSIRESGSVEQDADLIMMLWGPSDEEKSKEPELDGKRKVRIAKHRNGVLWTETLDFKNEIQLFEAIDDMMGGNWKKLNNGVVQGTASYPPPVNSFYETDREDDMPF